MITLLSAIRRKPGMSPADFRQYLQFTHGSIARANPLALSAYRQNFVVDQVVVDQFAGEPLAADRDNITELDFEGLPQLFQTMGHEYSRTVVGPDGVNFSDLPVASAMLVTVEPLDGGVLAGTIKAMALLGGSIAAAEVGRWQAAHAAVVERGVVPQASVILHRRMPEGDELVGYFGGADAERYSAAISMLGGSEVLGDLREYLVAIAEADAELVDPARALVATVDTVDIL